MSHNTSSLRDRSPEPTFLHFHPGDLFCPKEVQCFGAFIPAAVLGAADLSFGAKCFYGHCWRLSSNRGCFPTLRDSATALGVSSRQAKRFADELVKQGFLRMKSRFRDNGSQTSNGYEFLWHENMSEENFRLRRGDDVPVRGEGVGGDRARSDNDVIRGRPERSALEEKDSNHHYQEALIEARAHVARTVSLPEGGIPDAIRDGADDDESIGDPAEYATSEDELKAIVRAKTGQDIPWKELIWIKERLELQAVSFDDFVMAVRKHARNNWKNPIGFLKFFAGNFRQNTRPASPPLPKNAEDRPPRKCSCAWGYISQNPPTFCTTCQLGRELARDLANQTKREEKRREAMASQSAVR